MRKFLIVLAAGTMISAPVMAQESRVFHDPCERGPFPHLSMINGSRAHFVLFLQEHYKKMPTSTASSIADELCSDMKLVGNSGGLTERLHSLLAKYGYKA